VSAKRSGAAAIARVEAFLACMEGRDLEAATAHLGRGFSMTFPGPNTFRSLDRFAEWGKGRYRKIRNRVDRFDAVPDGDDVVVYAVGRASGVFGDGTDFKRVRFVDRFVIRGDRIVRMEAWSDISDVLLRAAAKGRR